MFINNLDEHGTIHGEFNFNHIIIDDNNISIIDWERVSQFGFRFFDLAEYIGRLFVSVEGGIDMTERILKEFKMKMPHFSALSFKFCLYHRIIGTLAEMKLIGEQVEINFEEQKRIIKLIEEFLPC